MRVSSRFSATRFGWGLMVTTALAGAAAQAMAAPINPATAERCNLPGALQAKRTSSTPNGIYGALTPSSQNIVSVSAAQPYVASGEPLLAITIKVQDLKSLNSGVVYYANFVTSPSSERYGVSMYVESGTTPLAPAVVSFHVADTGQLGGYYGNNGWQPAETNSNYTADGTITIYVKPKAVGLAPGQTLSQVSGRIDAPLTPNGGEEPADSTYSSSGTNPTFAPFPIYTNAVCAPNKPPVALLAVDNTSGNKPLAVVFSGLRSSDPDTEAGDGVGSYAFTFGDGDAQPTTNTTGKVGHIYTHSGTYTATLKVTDLRGGVSTNTSSVTLTAINQAPTVALKTNAVSGTAPLNVTFTATGADANSDDAGALAYSFDLDGDGVYELDYGASSSQQKTYSTPGDTTVGVRVRDIEGLVGINTAKIHVDKAAGPTTVNAFTFGARSGVAKATFVTSEAVTLAGSGSGTLAISVAGGNSMQYSLNGGAFTASAGTAKFGDKLVVRHLSASAGNTSVTTSVTVGSYTTSLKSTTVK